MGEGEEGMGEGEEDRRSGWGKEKRIGGGDGGGRRE